MIKIYHNPRCRKSRAGLAYLQEKTNNFEKVEYLKNPLSTEELKALFAKIDLSVEQMIRKQEAIYKTNFKDKSLSDDEWIQAIADNPKLLQRPIIETDQKAVLADPPENMDIFF